MASGQPPPGLPLERLPALSPPPGVTPNFVNPENYQSLIIALQTICLALATGFTALRIYTKLFIIKSFASEDYFSCFAWVGFVVYNSLVALSLAYGSGVHQWDVPMSNVLKYSKIFYVLNSIYCAVILPSKIAILLQISRIFVLNNKSIRFYLIQILIWTNTIYYTIGIFMVTFQCTPQAKAWNPTLPGHCLTGGYQISLVTGGLNITSDILILLLPVLWVFKLHMPRTRKVGVSLVFASGIFCCISSIMRLAMFLKWGRRPDFTWYVGYYGVWTLAEITSAIICGCLPAIPRAIDKFKSKISAIASSCLHTKKSPALRTPQDDYLKLNDKIGRQKDQTISKLESVVCHSEVDPITPFAAV